MLEQGHTQIATYHYHNLRKHWINSIRRFQGSLLPEANLFSIENFLTLLKIAASKVEGVVIATNGYQPERLHEVLKGLEKLTITVSLQGSRDVHDKFVGQNGAFEKSIETILLCLEQGHCVHVLTTAFTEAISSLPFLAGYLKNIPVSEHRINLVKFRGRVEREASSWEEVEKAISFVQPNYKLTVKRNGQPFIFIGSDGKEEKRYE